MDRRTRKNATRSKKNAAAGCSLPSVPRHFHVVVQGIGKACHARVAATLVGMNGLPPPFVYAERAAFYTQD
jgi:hypothetical protein